MSNLLVRSLVAVVGVPVIIALIMAGGPWFVGFVVIVASLGLHEFYQLAKAKGMAPLEWPGVAAGILLLVGIGAAPHLYPGTPQGLTAVTGLTFLLMIPVVLVVELFRNRGSAIMNIAATVSGVAYVALLFGSLLALRGLFETASVPAGRFVPPGMSLPPEEVRALIDRAGGFTVLAVFASIWISDSAAYFAGRAWGTHKLFPRVSPKKSWEGSAAGFAGGVITFVIIKMVLLPYLPVAAAIVCGVIVGTVGQLGDLAESLLKRDAGVKDSSGLIPGHGGVLDRFDSIMLVSPFIYGVVSWVVWNGVQGGM